MTAGQSDGAGSDVSTGDRGGQVSTCAIGAGKGPKKVIGLFGPSSMAGKVSGGDRVSSSGSKCAETGKDACNLQVDHSKVSRNNSCNPK